jgi:Fe-only nitrogenase accessory protein AnfO
MNISRIRLYIHELSSRLDGCKALVMRKSPGIFNAILEEELGIRIWTVNGQPFDAFPHIKAQTETAMDTAQGCASCRGTGETAEMAATPVGDLNDGLFQINLVEIQQKNSSLNSREILLPFLEQKKDFTELEIICLHIPKWLNEEMLEKLNIELTSGKRKDGFTHAFIYRLNRDE